MLSNLVRVGRSKGLPQGPRAQTRRAGTRVLVERPEGGQDVVSSSLWSETHIELTERRQVWWAVGSRVLVCHFPEGFVRVDKASAGEGLARLGVGPFAAEVFAPFLFERLFQRRGA